MSPPWSVLPPEPDPLSESFTQISYADVIIRGNLNTSSDQVRLQLGWGPSAKRSPSNAHISFKLSHKIILINVPHGRVAGTGEWPGFDKPPPMFIPPIMSQPNNVRNTSNEAGIQLALQAIQRDASITVY
jgi:hypothetical protein